MNKKKNIFLSKGKKIPINKLATIAPIFIKTTMGTDFVVSIRKPISKIGFLFLLVNILLGCSKKNIVSLKADENNSTLYMIVKKPTTDSLTFKMYQGLEKKFDTSEEMKIEISGLDSALFSFKILSNEDEEVYTVKKSKNVIQNYNKNIFVGNNNSFINERTDKSGVHDSNNFLETQIYSNNLEQERMLSIYTLGNPDESKTINVIYIFDGQKLSYLIPYIQDIFDGRNLNKESIIFVGVHSNTKTIKFDGMNFPARFIEYVKNSKPDNELYKSHQMFFIDEVIPFIESKYKEKTIIRTLYGVSNSGAFVVESGTSYPELFDKIIAYSTVGYIEDIKQNMISTEIRYPVFNIMYGKFEYMTLEDNRNLVSILKNRNVSVKTKEFFSGHDNIVWQQEFLKHIKDTY